MNTNNIYSPQISKIARELSKIKEQVDKLSKEIAKIKESINTIKNDTTSLEENKINPYDLASVNKYKQRKK